jgi:hypothetical protein
LTCTGSFENPWFCNLPVFNYNPVCNFPFKLTWNYDIESRLLSIDIYNKNGAPKNLTSPDSVSIKRMAGLVRIHLQNDWFDKPGAPLLNETFNWSGANNSTKIVKIAEDHYQLREVIEPEAAKCARIGILMFGNHTDLNMSNLLYKMSSSSEICTGLCERTNGVDASFRKVGKQFARTKK